MAGGGYPGQQQQPQVVYVEQQQQAPSKGSGMGKIALAGSQVFLGPTVQFYSKFSSALAGAGLLGGALLTEAIDRDDDWDRDDNRGYGDLQHYFTVLPFYSCLCLPIQTTVVMMEVISVGMEATFFRYYNLHHAVTTPFNLTGFVHNRPEIFFSLMTSSFSFHCPIYYDLLWLFYVCWTCVQRYTLPLAEKSNFMLICCVITYQQHFLTCRSNVHYSRLLTRTSVNEIFSQPVNECKPGTQIEEFNGFRGVFFCRDHHHHRICLVLYAHNSICPHK